MALVGLYAENDVLVRAAPWLLAQEQTGGQAGRLACDGHVVRSPHLAVFVHHSETPAGGAVPDALLGPDGEKTERVKTTHRKHPIVKEVDLLTRRGQLKRPGHQTSRWVSWH